jgi:hypothetical protein
MDQQSEIFRVFFNFCGTLPSDPTNFIKLLTFKLSREGLIHIKRFLDRTCANTRSYRSILTEPITFENEVHKRSSSKRPIKHQRVPPSFTQSNRR